MKEKRFARSLLCTVFIIIVILVAVMSHGFITMAADDTDFSRVEVRSGDPSIQEGGTLDPDDIYYNASSESTNWHLILMRKFQEAWEAGEDWVDVWDMGLRVDDEDAINSVIKSALNNNPDYFYLTTDYMIDYMPDTNQIIKIGFLYSVEDKAERVKMLAEYSAAVDAFKKGVNPAWSDMEKFIYIHDYLATHCEYDLSGKMKHRYDAYGVLVDKKAVCQGYSLAVNALAQRLGLESYYVTSYSLNHGWNMIKMNGKFYMMDVTWDDPTPDKIGRVDHDYMFKSMSWFQSEEGGHNATDFIVQDDVPPTSAIDTKYESYDGPLIWQYIHTAFQYIDGKWYALFGVDNSIRPFTCDGVNMRIGDALYYLDDVRWDTDYGNYYEAGDAAGFISHNGLLYYSLPDSIYSYNPKTGQNKKVYDVPENLKYLGDIIGLVKIEDNRFQYLISKNYDVENGTKRTVIPPEVEVDTEKPTISVSVGNDKEWGVREPGSVVYSNDAVFNITTDDNVAVSKASYFISNREYVEAELILIRESYWTKMADTYEAFEINQGAEGEYFVYARAEDTSGNTSYASLGKIVIDKTAPKVSLLNDKKEYEREVIVQISDEYLDKVYINGDETKLKDGKIKLAASDEMYEIKAIDKAKNVTTKYVNVMPSENVVIEGTNEKVAKTERSKENSAFVIEDSGVKYHVSEAVNEEMIKPDLSVADKKTSGKYKVIKVEKKSGKITGGTVTYVKPYNKNCKKATVPKTVVLDGVKFKVTAVRPNAFKQCKNLKEITIRSSSLYKKFKKKQTFKKDVVIKSGK